MANLEDVSWIDKGATTKSGGEPLNEKSNTVKHLGTRPLSPQRPADAADSHCRTSADYLEASFSVTL